MLQHLMAWLWRLLSRRQRGRTMIDYTANVGSVSARWLEEHKGGIYGRDVDR